MQSTKVRFVFILLTSFFRIPRRKIISKCSKKLLKWNAGAVKIVFCTQFIYLIILCTSQKILMWPFITKSPIFCWHLVLNLYSWKSWQRQKGVPGLETFHFIVVDFNVIPTKTGLLIPLPFSVGFRNLEVACSGGRSDPIWYIIRSAQRLSNKGEQSIKTHSETHIHAKELKTWKFNFKMGKGFE